VSRQGSTSRVGLAAGARATGILIVAVLAVACEQEAARPRSFEYFKEDGLAREGVLARCDLETAAQNDVECMNARRAASAVAAEIEQGRSPGLAAESERKLVAMRARSDFVEQAEQDATLATQAAAEAAYEAQWRDPKGAPVGKLRDDGAYNVESLSQVPTRPELELAAVAPPKGEILRPQIELEQNAVIPRPFRKDDETVRR
jgi:hypothetical protein